MLGSFTFLAFCAIMLKLRILQKKKEHRLNMTSFSLLESSMLHCVKYQKKKRDTVH